MASHALVSAPAEALSGTCRVPGDKSISHRSLMLGSLAVGRTEIHGLLEGEDVLMTAAAMGALGARAERRPDGSWLVEGRGIGGLTEPADVLDLGNAGTGARLLLGLLASHPVNAVLTGDRSLRSRPMARVAAPLIQMGARIVSREGCRLPLAITGAREPLPITYKLPVASAQVKSAILLAGLNTPGETTVIEPEATRDHTELMLRHFGASVRVEATDQGRRSTITGQPEIAGRPIRVPADPSSAAFPLVEAAVPERNSRITLRVGNIDYQTSILGTSADYTRTRGWDVAAGGFLTADDVRGYAPVIVLGQTVARNLFPDGEDPVGRYVLVRNVPMQVIGVLAPKGATPFGNDQDDIAVVPLTTGFVQLFGRQYLSTVSVKVTDAGQIDQTESAIDNLLQERHRTVDFQVRNTASILATAQETQGTLTLLLASVASISLLVGGIGVMNIMLVNVTERRREIGIRMATGARMRDILLQFNTEALVVCGVGGLIGVVFGLGLAIGAEWIGFPVLLSAEPALLAFACAFLTGLLFGFLPARKAARLDPVVALASE